MLPDEVAVARFPAAAAKPSVVQNQKPIPCQSQGIWKGSCPQGISVSLLASCSAAALRKVAKGQILPDEYLWRLGPSATVVWQTQYASCSEGWIMTML